LQIGLEGERLLVSGNDFVTTAERGQDMGPRVMREGVIRIE